MRILNYNILGDKRDISWEDIKRAALGNLSPLTPSEIAELIPLQNDDDAFFTRMWEMLKSDQD